MKNVIVLGASSNPDRYSYLAVTRLQQAGYRVFAIGRSRSGVGSIEIQQNWPTERPIHLVSMYLNATNQRPYYELILQTKPEKIIFNPGAENPELAEMALAHGILVEDACTLVLLSTHVI